MAGAAPVIVWFRDDLRLDDHPALHRAVAAGRPVVPVHVLEPGWYAGGAERWWLHHSLTALDRELARRGSRLILLRGRAAAVLPRLARELEAAGVHWNRCWSPAGRARDLEVAAALADVPVHDHPADLLVEPDAIATGQGTPYRVFTPFWRQLQRQVDPGPSLAAPAHLQAPAQWPGSDTPGGLGLLPRVDWAGGLRDNWRPGAAGAAAAWEDFRAGALDDYAAGRDLPAAVGTSRLSPHLRFGEIPVRRLWRDLVREGRATRAEPWLRQLAWRDFAHHLLHHYPHTRNEPLDPRFREFPWEDDARLLAAWQEGQTGYPLVDAGMRQLRTTGWMHNRVRMVAASFLVKHLRQPWQEGAAWFADNLVDHDVANNVLGWQWTAGCGADAAPFFRIFNPVAQGRRHDPQGDYVARWLPELAGLPARRRHAPWEAATGESTAAGVILGETYPRPVVDHAEARARALAAWEIVKLAPRDP